MFSSTNVFSIMLLSAPESIKIYCSLLKAKQVRFSIPWTVIPVNNQFNTVRLDRGTHQETVNFRFIKPFLGQSLEDISEVELDQATNFLAKGFQVSYRTKNIKAAWINERCNNLFQNWNSKYLLLLKSKILRIHKITL